MGLRCCGVIWVDDMDQPVGKVKRCSEPPVRRVNENACYGEKHWAARLADAQKRARAAVNALARLARARVVL